MNTLFLFTLFVLAIQTTSAGVILKFTLELEEIDIEIPVSVPIDGVEINNNTTIPALSEITADGEIRIPCQVDPGEEVYLSFMLPTSTSTKRNFVLRSADELPANRSGNHVSIRKNATDLVLKFKDQPILSYRHAIQYPPDSYDPIYKRSGFIHPLWSPEGEVLTRIQPPDHLHHYGIWGPWTKTHIKGRGVDFWNLALGQGTVKFETFLNLVEGKVFSGFSALQHHIDFGSKGEDQVALTEILEVKTWNTGGKIWIIDYISTINSPLDSGILFDAYRYGGGLGFRATGKWTKENCTVLTSEGKTRVDADGTKARWCIIEGESEAVQKRSGVLFMSHPSNRMHPEPMRVWPEKIMGGRGDMFFEFTPIRNEPWKIEKYQNYALFYRMVVFDGEMDSRTAEKYWKAFAEKGIKFRRID